MLLGTEKTPFGKDVGSNPTLLKSFLFGEFLSELAADKYKNGAHRDVFYGKNGRTKAVIKGQTTDQMQGSIPCHLGNTPPNSAHFKT